VSAPIAAALANVKLALNRPERFDPSASTREFTLALTDVAEIYFMPRLIDCCQAIAPQIRLATVRPGGVDLKVEMEAGRIDVAIGAFDKMSSALYQLRLFRQPFVTLFRTGHVLGQQSMLTLEAFLEARHILVASSESPFERINQLLEKAGVRETSHYRVPHFTAVPYIVSSTDLLVTVPQKLAERAAAPFNLSWLRTPLRLPVLQTNLFWHRRYNEDEGNQWLRQIISSMFIE
jgi:DNA-binding transcriptional LysR family regulator